MYGAAVEKWKGCRDLLLDEKTKKVFNNGFLERAGLDS
jgi:hypothetical protein